MPLETANADTVKGQVRLHDIETEDSQFNDRLRPDTETCESIE